MEDNVNTMVDAGTEAIEVVETAGGSVGKTIAIVGITVAAVTGIVIGGRKLYKKFKAKKAEKAADEAKVVNVDDEEKTEE